MIPSLAQRILRLPFYPWLLGAVPILHLYSVNFGAIIDREVPISLFWVMASTSVAFLATNLVLRNRHESALVIACIVIGFSFSGHVHSLLFENEWLVIWTLAVLIALAIAITELRGNRAWVYFMQAAIPINLIATALILLQIATIATRYTETYSEHLAGSIGVGANSNQPARPKALDSTQRPDIYYIIPDGYPSDNWHINTAGYDNSPFSDALRARGFEVVPHAQSNYGITLPSLASTLNMRHFNANPTELRDPDYLRLSVSNSEVFGYLQQLGYTIVQFLSGYLFPSSIADINRDFTPNGAVEVSIDNEDLTVTLWDTTRNARKSTGVRRLYQQSFVSLYIETTLLKLFDNELRDLLEGYYVGPYDLTSPRRFLATIDEVRSVVSMPEATFTLIHLLKPHRPVSFDEQGNIIDEITQPNTDEYNAELNFVNSKFIELIDIILAGSRQPPVIVFQADHGSTIGAVRSSDRRAIHFDVYSAYLVPAQYALAIPRPHTLVNTFPLVLNAVFDAGFEYQENRLFELGRHNDKPFVQDDVTEIFAH